MDNGLVIYRQAICAICQTEQEVADQVRRTVIHEVAHHFGIDDRRLRELGWLHPRPPPQSATGACAREPPLDVSEALRCGAGPSGSATRVSPVPPDDVGVAAHGDWSV